MEELTRQVIAFGIAAPLVIAMAVIAPGTAKVCSEGERDRFGWRIPLGLAVPVILAFLVLCGWPTDQWHHVLFVSVVGLIVGIVMAFTPRGFWRRGLLFVILGVLATVAIWPVIGRESIWWKLGVGVGTFALTAGLEPLAARRPGVSLPGGLALSVVTVMAIVWIGGFLTLAVPVMSLAVGLGACGLIALRRCRFSLADGAVAVVAPLLVVPPIVVWLYMLSYGDPPPPAASFILPAAAPLVLWLGEIPALRRRSAWLAVPVRWGLVIIVCALAVLLAVPAGNDAEQTDPMDGYDMLGWRSLDETTSPITGGAG